MLGSEPLPPRHASITPRREASENFSTTILSSTFFAYPVRVTPEERRVKELAAAIKGGVASEAEKEEIALYLEQSPALSHLVAQVERERDVGGTWLARAEADRRLDAQEKTPWSRLERKVGTGLVFFGGALGLIFPPAWLLSILGMAMISWSVIRVKLNTLKDDPYDDVEL